MEWLSNIFSATTSGIIDSIGNAIDKNITNTEEKLVLRNELAKIQTEAQAKSDEIDVRFEQEISKRHESDMKSDNKLSKNIRPASLIFLLLVVSVLSVTDGNIQLTDSTMFTVGGEYINLFKSLLMVAFGFYFGGRSLEKVVSKVWK